MYSRLVVFAIRGLPWVVMFGGGVLLANGLLDFVRAVSSRDWPTAEGTIVSSEVDSETRSVGDGQSSTSCWPKVGYDYTVNDKTYSGDTIAFSSLRSGPHIGSGRAEAQVVVDRYPVGKQVRVYYNPKDPEIAALESGDTALNFIAPVAGVFLILFGYGLRRMFGPGTSSAEGEAIRRLEDFWAGKERSCPRCDTQFTSVQNKGICPKCHFAFHASHPDNADDYPS